MSSACLVVLYESVSITPTAVKTSMTLLLTGWEGDTCEKSVDDCHPHRCVNGQCIDGHLNYTCQCDLGYKGMVSDRTDV